jgi:hypothetical protein
MKKLFTFLLFMFVATVVFAANSKFTDLTEDASPSTDDIIATVDDPGGTPASRKATIANVLVDGNIPNDITIDNASTADALSANGANCSAGNSPLGVDASGAVESCFDVVTQDEYGSPSLDTLSDVGSATATIGNLLIADGDSWETQTVSGDVTIGATGAVAIGDNVVGTDEIDLTIAPTWTSVHTFSSGIASDITGDVTGNSDTATALAANPAACGAGDFVTDIDADGTLTCDTPAGGGSAAWSRNNSDEYLHPASSVDTTVVLVGGSTLSTADHIFYDDGQMTVNEQGNNQQFRVENSLHSDMVFTAGAKAFVGIGTTDEAKSFATTAPQMVIEDSTSSSETPAIIFSKANNGLGNQLAGGFWFKSGSAGNQIGTIHMRNQGSSENSGEMHFYTSDSGSSGLGIAIKQDQDVGIGTSTPSQELDIIGDVETNGVIYIAEQADASADVASYGQIWVNTATPNELWFTDDAGTDFQLGQSSSFTDIDTDYGDQTVTSQWTFNNDRGLDVSDITATGNVTVVNDAYDATNWNGNTQVPTKDAVRDKIETIVSGGATQLDELSDVGTVSYVVGELLIGTGGAFDSYLPTGDVSNITAGVFALDTDFRLGSFGITFDGGGSAVTAGTSADIELPYNATIEEVRMFADLGGNAVVDIWKDTYANYPPTDADSITASATPTITDSNKSTDTTLTGWTTNVDSFDVIRFHVDSATTATRLHVNVTVTKNP